MFRMIQTEIWKLKRYHIVWAGVLLMLLSVLLTVFTTTAMDGEVWTFPFFAEQVMKNNITMIFPMCITLITGYIIAREERDDTLKSILTVPISYRSLLGGKMAACALLSFFLGTVSVSFTVAANLILGFPGLSPATFLKTAAQMIFNCLFLYFAVTPIIAASARMPNGHMIGTIVAFVYGYGVMFAAGKMSVANFYPIAASMGLVGYRSYDEAVNWNVFTCSFSLAVSLLVAAFLVFTARESTPPKAKKKMQKTVTKKGW